MLFAQVDVCRGCLTVCFGSFHSHRAIHEKNSWCHSFTFPFGLRSLRLRCRRLSPACHNDTNLSDPVMACFSSPFLPHVVGHPLGALPECEVDCPCRSDSPPSQPMFAEEARRDFVRSHAHPERRSREPCIHVQHVSDQERGMISVMTWVSPFACL